MGLFNRLRRAAQVIISGDLEAEVAAIFGRTRTYPKRGTAALLRAYSEMPWLRSVMTRISVSTASVPWQLWAVGQPKEGKGKWSRDWRKISALQNAGLDERKAMMAELKQAGELVEIENHLALDILNEANPFMSGWMVRKTTQIHMDMVGEEFHWLVRNGAGVPIAAFPVPPHWIMDIPSPSDRTFRVSVAASSAGGGTFIVPEEDMIYIRDPDPSDPYGRGSGVGRALADELDTDEATAKYVKSWFYNNAMPPAVISGKAIKDEKTRSRLERLWLQKFRGLYKGQAPAFVTGEGLQIDPLGHTFEQMRLVPLREFERNTIIQVLNVPPEVMGIIENSNRATIEAADYLFSRHCIVPRMEAKRAFLQMRLIPEYDDRLILDYLSPVQEDKEHNLNVMKAAPYAWQIDEWRMAAGDEPLPDDGGKIHMMPLALIPVESPADGKEEATPLPDTEEDAKALRRRLERGEEYLLLPAGEKQEPEDIPPSTYYSAIHRIAQRLEGPMRKRFVAAVNSLRGAIDTESLLAAVRSGNVEAVINSIPWTLYDEKLAGFKKELRRAFNLSGEMSAAQLAEQIGLDITFDQTNPRAVEWANANAARLVSNVGAEQQKPMIRQLVTNAFREGVEPTRLASQIRDTGIGLTERQMGSVRKFEAGLRAQGLDEAVIQRRTKRYYDAWVRRRSLTIARTETIAASSNGQQELWRQAVENGILDPDAVQRIWIVTLDDRLDTKICEPMDGQKVGMEENFTTGIGAAVMTPPAHPMCRCAIGLVFKKKGRTLLPWYLGLCRIHIPSADEIFEEWEGKSVEEYLSTPRALAEAGR